MMMNLTVVSTGIWLCLIALFHSRVFCLKKRAKGANEKTFLKENVIIFNSTVLEQAQYYKDLYHIEMTVADIAFLMKELSLVKSAYFEFGMGAQTSMSCEFALKYNFILYAVHSSSDTIDEISNDPCLRQLIEDGQANLLKIDIGITGKYGVPLNSNDTENFHFYSDAINRIRTHVDLILVDGRFRIASVLKSLIKFPNSRILLHDYYEPYHYRVYSPVRNYAYVMESSDTFVRLRRKEEISDDMIKLGLPKFANRIQ
jgi:hypothetical protein